MGDKFEEHMCKPQTKELIRENGEKDIFTFQPLGFEYMPQFFSLVRKFYSFTSTSKKNIDDMTDDDTRKFVEALDEGTLKIMHSLLEAMLRESYPDEFKTEESKKKMSKFMARNMMELLPVLVEMNSPSASVELEKTPQTMGAQNELTPKSDGTEVRA